MKNTKTVLFFSHLFFLKSTLVIIRLNTSDDRT